MNNIARCFYHLSNCILNKSTCFLNGIFDYYSPKCFLIGITIGNKEHFFADICNHGL